MKNFYLVFIKIGIREVSSKVLVFHAFRSNQMTQI